MGLKDMFKPKPKPAAKKKSEYPRAKVGNYQAPVDTAGMDPEMKKTMGIGKKKGK
jgi:hypothetical protein